MNTTLLIIIIVAIVVVIAIVAAIFIFSGGSSNGDEEENGNGEQEREERREEVERDTEPLSDESRGRYEEKWEEVEQVFVENPDRSIEMADRTVSDILEERNFVKDASQDDQETEKRLAVAYPDIADDYRRPGRCAPTWWTARAEAAMRAMTPAKTKIPMRITAPTTTTPRICARPFASIARSTTSSQRARVEGTTGHSLCCLRALMQE
ncbi:hypothetical protein BH24ACT21_BH24ACT21_14390 [soil metagenome]